MKFLSDNVMVLMLTLVMGLSPLQNIVASVSNCMGMDNTMHHQMKMSDNTVKMDMNNLDSKPDCCNKNECGTAHCASTTIVAAIPSNNINNIIYTFNNVYQKPNIVLIPFYSPSLYRPPRV